MDVKKISQIIEKHQTESEEKTPSLIPILQDIQDEYGWLPEQAFNITSRKLGIPLVNLYGLATFYNEFRLTPIGDYHIAVCTGTACHVKGAPRILAELERQLGIKAGEVTPDQKYSLETASCFGCCAVAPVIKVNERFYGDFSQKKAAALIKELDEGGTNSEQD